MKDWYNQYCQVVNIKEKVVYLIGNKVDDKKNRVIDKEVALDFANKLNAKYFETSAISGENINSTFKRFFLDLLLKNKKNEKDEKNLLKINDSFNLRSTRRKWKDDKREGRGIYYYNKENWKGDLYEGDWKNNKREGKGIYYYHNIGSYDGDWKNNKREGKGVFYYINDDRYEGGWKNSKREGRGIFYYANGDREMGDYINDNKAGKHITLTFGGEIKVFDYSNNKEYNLIISK